MPQALAEVFVLWSSTTTQLLHMLKECLAVTHLGESVFKSLILMSL